MRSNRAMTLISLVIYIIGLIIVITLMVIVENHFFNNVNDIVSQSSSQEQYVKFLSYITKDINSEDLEFVRADNNYVIIQLKNNIQHQYIYKNGIIYYLKIEKETNNEENTTKKIALCYNVSDSNGKIFNYNKNNKSLDINLYIYDDKFSHTLNIKNN